MPWTRAPVLLLQYFSTRGETFVGDIGNCNPLCGGTERVWATLLAVRLVPRTRVGRDEVVALLGTGGMADVYRAKDTRLGREVAIEVVSEALGADQPVVGVEHSAISTCSTGWFRLAAEQGGRAAEEST